MLKVRIVILSCVFCVVAYAIYSLNTGRLKFDFLNDSSQINWCATRVIEIAEDNAILPYRVFQEGQKWIKESDTKAEIAAPNIEKWLGEYCSIKVDEKLAAPPTTQEKLSTIRVRLLSGQTFEFQRLKGGVYRLGENQWFKSNEWDVALAKLASLEQAGRSLDQ